MAHFIFMLTHNDVTVADAREVFATIADLPIHYVGFKDIGLPPNELKLLAEDIRSNGQEVMLEVVSEAKDDEMKSLRAAKEIGVHYVMGGTHANEGISILAGSGIQYMPFPGRVVGHPSVLCGPASDIVNSAIVLASLDGVTGLDLLAYRYSGDVEALIRAVVEAVPVPVVAAGSIASEEQIKTVTKLGVWGFTVGSAVFENSFRSGERSLRGQLSAILAAADVGDLRQNTGKLT
jgi:hypothetical protein